MFVISSALAQSFVVGPTGNLCDAANPGFTRIGDAQCHNPDIVLIDEGGQNAGVAFWSAPMPVDPHTSFRMQLQMDSDLVNFGNPAGAAFFFRALSPQLGEIDEGLGYSTNTQSIGVELDVWDGGSSDADANHVGLVFDGEADGPHPVSSPVSMTDR